MFFLTMHDANQDFGLAHSCPKNARGWPVNLLLYFDNDRNWVGQI